MPIHTRIQSFPCPFCNSCCNFLFIILYCEIYSLLKILLKIILPPIFLCKNFNYVWNSRKSRSILSNLILWITIQRIHTYTVINLIVFCYFVSSTFTSTNKNCGNSTSYTCDIYYTFTFQTLKLNFFEIHNFKVNREQCHFERSQKLQVKKFL